MKTGEIYRVCLDPTVGDEIRKTRPVVLLNAGHQKHLRLAIVVPITHWRKAWDSNPFFVTIAPQPRHGLKDKLAIDCFQMRALSHDRFVRRLGCLNDDELDRVKAAVSLILDIESRHCESAGLHRR